MQGDPKLAITSEWSDVHLSFDQAMYQKLLAIGDALTLEPEILKMLQTDKALAIKKAKK